MRSAAVFQVALVVVVACASAVHATPSTSSLAARFDANSELMERYPSSLDEESTYNVLWDSLTTSGADEDAYEEHESEGLEKRAALQSCRFDYNCPSDRYCSTKRNKCYKKLSYKTGCTRDTVCSTGYCGRRSRRCASQKSNGANCFTADMACTSGYCSVVTEKCARKRDNGETCFADKACRSSHCTNGKCTKQNFDPIPEPKPTPTGTP